MSDGRSGLIALVGMRGAGKTTVGRLLADRLGRHFVDADGAIERDLGRTIADVFATGGEAAFREAERRVLLRLLEDRGSVLATGGGAVLHADVRARLRDAFTVWLSAPATVLAARIAGSDRPSLTGAEPTDEVAAVLAAREAFYTQAASLVVDATDGPAAIVARILAALPA